MKDTMNTILLITLSKDTNCPYNQRIKLNNILKKRENIILKYTNANKNNARDNQINANIPIPVFIKRYEHRKYSAAININKTKNAPRINLKKSRI